MKELFIYLYATRSYEIYYWRKIPIENLPAGIKPTTKEDNFTHEVVLSDTTTKLIAFSDSDWAGDLVYRISVTCIAVMYAKGGVRLNELTASVKAKLTVARDIAHAGNGDDDMSDIYYARLMKSLVLIGLHNSSSHSQIFADIRFLDTLRNCRDADWSEITWSEVIDHVQIYEAANQERNYDGSLADSLKSSAMVTSTQKKNDQQNEISGEVIQQIKISDCRKEISTWTLEEMKGRCFTCGEVPCLHKQEDGKCAG